MTLGSVKKSLKAAYIGIALLMPRKGTDLLRVFAIHFQRHIVPVQEQRLMRTAERQ